MKSFKFLESHFTIRSDTRQLGKVPQVLQEEEEAENDDASSVRSSSQLPSSAQANLSQADPSHIKDSRSTRPKALSTTAKTVDKAILQIADQRSLTRSVQDQLSAVVQGGSNDWIAWCQWMGLETSKLSENLWTSFMQKSFSMILHFRQLQQWQQVPHHPQQPPQHPGVQHQQQSAFVRPSSAPPMVTPPYWQQQQQQQHQL